MIPHEWRKVEENIDEIKIFPRKEDVVLIRRHVTVPSAILILILSPSTFPISVSRPFNGMYFL